jgi:hypothetical protein
MYFSGIGKDHVEWFEMVKGRQRGRGLAYDRDAGSGLDQMRKRRQRKKQKCDSTSSCQEWKKP